jgi:hypothetical protein
MCIVDFLLQCPFKEGVLQNYLKRLPAVISDSPLKMMRGVVILCIKKYGEYRLSTLNSRPKFLQKIHTFVTPHGERCQEFQLSIVNNMGSMNSPL